jgi:hypothetical protein
VAARVRVAHSTCWWTEKKIASDRLEYHPAELLDREYQVPERLTRGKSRITVRFEPQENARTGGVVEIRTTQLER